LRATRARSVEKALARAPIAPGFGIERAVGGAGGIVISGDQCYDRVMKTISAAKFKERCLSLLDAPGPEGIVITKRGKPVARLVPYVQDCRALLGSLKGKLHVRGDVIGTGVKWDAQS
jgi:prevent-host-death family protein